MIGTNRPSESDGKAVSPRHRGERADTDEMREARWNRWAHYYWRESEGEYGWPPWEWVSIDEVRQRSRAYREAAEHRSTHNE